MWRTFPHGWWIFESALIVTLWAYYWRRSTADATFGGRSFVIAAVLLVLHMFNSPWLAQF